MKTTFSEQCENCRNIPKFEKYATEVTDREQQARVNYPLGCNIGRISCAGRIVNEIVGDFCDAKLVNPVVPDRPEEVQRVVSPAATIREIPGYSIKA